MQSNVTGNDQIDGVIQLFLGVIGLVYGIGFFVGQRKPKRPDIPSGIQVAATLLLTTGGFFMVVGIACGVLFTDLPRFWRLAWISIAAVVGLLWTWNAFRVRQGSRSARWASVPFLAIAIPSLPLLGWVSVPIIVYCLFVKRTSRQFFQGRTETYSSRIRLSV